MCICQHKSNAPFICSLVDNKGDDTLYMNKEARSRDIKDSRGTPREAIPICSDTTLLSRDFQPSFYGGDVARHPLMTTSIFPVVVRLRTCRGELGLHHGVGTQTDSYCGETFSDTSFGCKQSLAFAEVFLLAEVSALGGVLGRC